MRTSLRHRSRIATGIVLVLLATLSSSGSRGRSESLAPEMLAPGDPAWDDLWRLTLSGALPPGATAIRPLSRGEVAAMVARAARDPRADPASLMRLERAFARELRREGLEFGARESGPAVRLAGDASTDTLALDGARSELRLGPELSVQARGGHGDSELGDSTRAGLYGAYLIGRTAALQGEIFVGKIKNGRAIGDPLIAHTDVLYFSEDVGAAADVGDLRLRLARGRHHWGPGPWGSLLLNEGSAPIDFVEWSLPLPAGIRFLSWTGTLNAFEERGIAAHRLEIPLSSSLTLGLSEGVRYRGGPGQTLYLLGLLPYTLVQRLDAQDSAVPADREAQRNNVLAAVDAAWRPRPGSLLYSEILVDDLPSASASSPARVGARLGIAAMPRVAGGPLEVVFEGTKVSRYTYAVEYGNGCECDWIAQGTSIGDPDGPDQEALRLGASRSFGRDHRIDLTALYMNRGSGNLGLAWDPSIPHPPDLSRWALTVAGPVERTRSLTLLWRWDPRDNLFLECSGSAASVRDPGNEAGGGRVTRFLAALRAGWKL